MRDSVLSITTSTATKRSMTILQCVRLAATARFELLEHVQNLSSALNGTFLATYSGYRNTSTLMTS